MNYAQAKELLGTKSLKKVDHNTHLRMEDGNAVICLWGTDIVSISPDDIYTLNAGGYQTVTTKDRLNKFAPVSVYQVKNVWYINDRVPFFDGIRVNSAGMVIA